MAEIKLKIASVVIGSGEGGGSGVAPYYADLPDKPSINGETLSGDMTSEDLGLASSEQSVPAGGTTGQVLAKKSNADNDVQWVNQESGEQGTTDYADLENKPKINNVTLSGNKTTSQLGLQAELVSGTNIKTINNQSIVGSGNIIIEGQQGVPGLNSYLHIMYSRNMPESDSDISSTFEAGYRYIGICTDNNQTAPSTYESYQWAKFVGNDGGGGGLTTEERAAIVALFKAAVYTSGTGIDDLIDIIENPPITKTVIGLTISVPSPQPNVYAGQNLDDVKPYLTVTASYDDNTSAVVTAYTLSGDISTTGTKQITASYTENGVTVSNTFDLVVSVAPTLYQVTSNLTNCTSNGSSSVYEHNQYQAVITPNNGYTLTGATVTVTMGGVDISSSYVNGVITITDVTGNITIAVTAAAKVLTGITATLDAQTPNFSVGDSLDVIKPYLTVTAQYSNAPDDTLTDTDYTLSSNDGDTLITGTNTIIVTYQSQTDSVSVTAVAAPVFFNKINLQGGAYIETDIMLPENFSMILVCDNANTGSTKGYGIIGCSGSTSGKFELNMNSWGNNYSKNYYYYGTDNYTGSLQLNTTDYPSWTPWMTPNKYGNGGATKTYTKGAGTPNGVLVVGKTSHANKYQGFFYASSNLNGGCIKILGDYAQNAGYEDLLSMAALYTLKPCVYNNEHGLWCLENNTFYGNTASVGTITCSNNE